MNSLTALEIKKADPGKMFDGGGLWLHRKEVGGNWIWRYSFGGRRREMGLGSYPAISLQDARRQRDQWATTLSRGLDPITERAAVKQAAIDDMNRTDPTFADIAQMVLDAKKAGLRGGGNRGRWMSPINSHVVPALGKRAISTILPIDIKTALAPIWHTKPPTAEKTMQRLMLIFRQAKLMGYDCDVATVETAKHMLGEVRHTATPIVSTHWSDIPALYQALEGRGPVTTCLQWMILTLVRSDGCRKARLSEIDGGIWTVPADRIKGREGEVYDFRVPLPKEAERLFAQQAAFGGTYMFTAMRGQPISDTALAKSLNEMGEAGRPHGFRASFRTWAEETDQPWDVAETILGHNIKTRIERSYARSDLIDRRRVVMDRWAAHVTGEAAQVVKLRGTLS